jgi:hypothetical protein
MSVACKRAGTTLRGTPFRSAQSDALSASGSTEVVNSLGLDSEQTSQLASTWALTPMKYDGMGTMHGVKITAQYPELRKTLRGRGVCAGVFIHACRSHLILGDLHEVRESSA